MGRLAVCVLWVTVCTEGVCSMQTTRPDSLCDVGEVWQIWNDLQRNTQQSSWFVLPVPCVVESVNCVVTRKHAHFLRLSRALLKVRFVS